MLANLERAGFQGAIHLINPKRAEIGGRRCLASVDDLPEGVDAAVLAIPRAAVLDAVRALARRKAGAAIIFSSGFAETGAEGLAEQRELARIAAESDMAIEGPNCLGLVNFVDGVPLTFVELPGDRLGARPGIGLVSQSGAMAAVLAVTLASRGLGLSYSISTGNEAASGVEDYVDYLVDDPDTHDDRDDRRAVPQAGAVSCRGEAGGRDRQADRAPPSRPIERGARIGCDAYRRARWRLRCDAAQG